MTDETVLRSGTDPISGTYNFPTPVSASPSKQKLSDPHPTWLHQLRALDLRLANTSEQSARWSAAWAEREHISQLMCQTEAATWDGVAAQMSWINDELAPLLAEASDTPFPSALENIRQTLLNLQASQNNHAPSD